MSQNRGRLPASLTTLAPARLVDQLWRSWPELLRLGDAARGQAMQVRLDGLAKPPGGLGRVESLLVWLAHWQGGDVVALDRVRVRVFVASHGITAQNVSAHSSAITGHLLALHRARRGLAIDRIAKALRVECRVIALALAQPSEDFSRECAMTERVFADAFVRGMRSIPDRTDLLCLGEIGIGNTSAAAALALALYGGAVEQWVGLGAGLAESDLPHKCRVIEQAVVRFHDRVGARASEPLYALRYFGGREMAAICGAVVAARWLRIPVMLDGFVATMAAAALAAVDRAWLDHCQVGQLSREPGHGLVLARLGMDPVLALDLAVGEGVGAVLAVPMLRAGLACVEGMSLFADLATVAGDAVG